MGQKVNPLSLRLGKTNLHFDSCWFNDSNYVHLVMRDLQIQSYINVILKHITFSSAKYSIQHLPTKMKIHVFFLNPNKAKTHVSKVFFFKNSKKIRKSKKNLLSWFSLLHQNSRNSLAKQSQEKQNFSFLQKKKNSKKATPCSSTEIKKQKILHYLVNTCHFHALNHTKKIVFNPYFTLLAYTNKANQVYLKYFLVKYFSHKVTYFPMLRACFFSKQKVPELDWYTNMAYLNNTNFLFFKSHKNKFGLALLNLQRQVHNYETVFMSDCLTKKHTFLNKSTFHNEMKNHHISLQRNKKKLTYSMSVLIVQLQILNYIQKKNDNFLQYKVKSTNFLPILNSLLKKNTDFNLFHFFTNTKISSIASDNSIRYSDNHILVCENNTNLKREIPHRFHFNEKLHHVFHENTKNYENISKVNNQFYNITYNNYCRLSQYSVYKNFVFSDTKSAHSTFFHKPPYFTLMTPPHKLNIQSCISDAFLCNTNLQFFQTSNFFASANFLIDEIIYYIEKKVPFFKIKNYILRKLTEEKFLRIKGLRVMCSGRVGGKSKKAQRSKIQHFKYGETSLHVFSSKIDFKAKNAFTTFGTLGVKVWICYY